MTVHDGMKSPIAKIAFLFAVCLLENSLEWVLS